MVVGTPMSTGVWCKRRRLTSSRMRLRYAVDCAVVFVATALGGCNRACPEIACVPIISVAYSGQVDGAYDLAVSVLGHDYGTITCPQNIAPPLGSAVTCDSSGFTVQGPELFDGANPPNTIAIDVRSLSASTITVDGIKSVTASVSSSLNGNGCEMNCYRAAGTLDVGR
jgi:hypothetical protein